MPKKTGKQITLRQLNYARGRMAGLTKQQAYEQSGFEASNRVSRNVAISRLENDVDLKRYIQENLEAEGVTLQKLARKVNEGLDATVTQAFCTKAGDVVYSKEMNDMQTRHKYVATAADLLGVTSVARRNDRANDAPTVTTNVLMLQRARELSDEDLQLAMQRAQAGLPFEHMLSAKAPESAEGTQNA